MIFWMIVFGILALAIALVVGVGKYERRTDEQVADTADWIETEATIQSAAIERLNKYTWFPGFAFSYSVKGKYFSGRFFLRAEDEQSQELIKTLVGQQLPVQYDPDDPSAWFISENAIAGCEIIQKLSLDYPPDSGLYRDDGDAPIDLHLNR